MAEMRSTIYIAAQPEAVFDYIDHWPNAMRYLKRLVRWEPVDREAGTGVGTVFRVGLQAGPTRLDGKLEVTEYERPRSIRIRSLEGPRVVGGWSLRPEGAGTRVVLQASYDLPGGIAGRIVGSFVARHGQRDLDASLAELKRLVEQSDT